MPLFFVVVLRSGSRFYSLVVSTDVNAANKKIENMKYGKRIRGYVVLFETKFKKKHHGFVILYLLPGGSF